jgi:hypothetical protein
MLHPQLQLGLLHDRQRAACINCQAGDAAGAAFDACLAMLLLLPGLTTLSIITGKGASSAGFSVIAHH